MCSDSPVWKGGEERIFKAAIDQTPEGNGHTVLMAYMIQYRIGRV
jgi:hypothetical protein